MDHPFIPVHKARIRNALSAVVAASVMMVFTCCAPKDVTRTVLSPTEDTSMFVMLADAVPDAILEIRYFSTYNFVGQRIDGYLQPQAMLTRQAADRLRAVSDELKAKGMEADYEEILKNVQERDYIDSHREVSPLRKADDAIELDNSNMTIPEQKQWLLDRFNEAVRES